MQTGRETARLYALRPRLPKARRANLPLAAGQPARRGLMPERLVRRFLAIRSVHALERHFGGGSLAQPPRRFGINCRRASQGRCSADQQRSVSPMIGRHARQSRDTAAAPAKRDRIAGPRWQPPDRFLPWRATNCRPTVTARADGRRENPSPGRLSGAVCLPSFAASRGPGAASMDEAWAFAATRCRSHPRSFHR